MTRENNTISTTRKILVFILSVLMCLSLFLASACAEEDDDNSSIPEYSYQEKSDCDIDNPDFNYGTSSMSYADYPKTAISGWNISKTATSNSGVIDVSDKGWKELLSNLAKDNGILNYVRYTNGNFTDADIRAEMIEKYNNEYNRLKEMRKFEDPLNELGIEYIAGIDEAGRGPLAGPVVAGAVILPSNLLIEGLNDSKKVSPKKREILFDVITENATAYGVGIMNEKIIDDINILQATRKAMIEAVCNLETKPQHLLVDAEKLDMGIPFNAIISGDALSLSIAAASIIAKDNIHSN